MAVSIYGTRSNGRKNAISDILIHMKGNGKKMTYPEKLEYNIDAFHPSWEKLEGSDYESNFHFFQAAGCGAIQAAELTVYSTAIIKWRKHRAYYMFDATLAETLLEQSKVIDDTQKLPSELLVNLPFPAIAVHLPVDTLHVEIFDRFRKEYNMPLTGDFILHVSQHRIFGEQSTLDIMAECGSEIPCGWSFPLKQETIAENIRQFCDVYRAADNMSPVVRSQPDRLKQDMEALQIKITVLLIQAVLYLQAQNSDLVKIPASPRKKSKGKPKLKSTKSFQVGYNIGATIRKEKRIYEKSETIKTDAASKDEGVKTCHKKRSHIRRGHFHSYWIGKKDGSQKRELIVKWVAPMYIHSNERNDKLTMYPVK